MSKKPKGKKLKIDFNTSNGQISKYQTIVGERQVEGRPGEELFEITTADGKTTYVSLDEKRRLDKLKK